MIALIVLALSVLAGVLYRWGGQGKPFNTKYRDLGCPLVAVASLAIIGCWHWSLILVFGLMFGAMTTYWKKKGTDAEWYNWAITAFFYAIAVLPVVWVYGLWIPLAWRVVCNTFFITLWSESIDSDVWEERGRGFINNITLLFFI